MTTFAQSTKRAFGPCRKNSCNPRISEFEAIVRLWLQREQLRLRDPLANLPLRHHFPPFSLQPFGPFTWCPLLQT